MAMNVHWTRISDKDLELDFLYIFVSNWSRFTNGIRYFNKTKFQEFILKLDCSALVTHSKQSMIYRTALRIKII